MGRGSARAVVGVALATVALGALAAMSACLVSLEGYADGPADGGGLDGGDGGARDGEGGGGEGGASCDGKDCLGGGCVAGACTPGVVASGQGGPRGVAVFEDHVYWVDATGEIMRAPKTGGVVSAAETLAKGTELVSLAVDASGVYVTDDGAGSIGKVPLAGGAIVSLATGETSPWGIALDDTYAYYTTSSMIRRVKKDGSAAAETLATGSMPRKIVVANGRVYWLDEQGTGDTVDSRALDGGTTMCHFNGQTLAHGLAVDGQQVFHTLNQPAPNGKVRRKQLSETCQTQAIEIGTGLESPFELAQDATTLFWTIDIPDGGIGTMDKAGTLAPSVLVSGQASPWGIDVDDATGAIYWTTSVPDGGVMVLAR